MRCAKVRNLPLARQLNWFDATMIVMGGIIGSGIFINPYVVAQQVHTPLLILGAWLFGGAVAMAGAFLYAELAVRRPATGGQYAYLRDAFHPGVAFVYGWCLLLVMQTGGMAAVAVTFAKYLIELTGIGLPASVIAAITLAALAGINILGVRAGGTTQNVLMVLKLGAIAMLVAAGFSAPVAIPAPMPVDTGFRSFGTALTPVLFAYGGWQTASFVSGEMKNPQRDLARGLIVGVSGVIVLYLAVTFVCLRVLGPVGLAATTTPATAVMRAAMGPAGARLIAAGIAISTLGFLSQCMLTAPRVYYAMARDGVFFQSIGELTKRSQTPAAAILLQAATAAVVAVSGRYDQILNYVVSIDFIWFGLTGVALFVFRTRERAYTGFKTPLHPVTTAFFVLACWAVVVSTFLKYPSTSFIGLGILASGIPVYYLWSNKN